MLKLTYLASQVRLSITNYRDKSSIKYRKITCFDVFTCSATRDSHKEIESIIGVYLRETLSKLHHLFRIFLVVDAI